MPGAWGLEPGGDNGTYFQSFPHPYTEVKEGGFFTLYFPSGKQWVAKQYSYPDNYMPQPDIFGNVMSLPAEAIVLPNGTYAIRGDNKDKGQRLFCECMRSKDIGEYGTCIHLCKYCYANATKDHAVANYRQHKLSPMAESITGK